MFIDDNDKVVNMTMPKNEYENGFDQNRLLAVLGYMTIIGWLISLVLYGKHKSSLLRFHLRQSLGLFISATFFMVVPLQTPHISSTLLHPTILLQLCLPAATSS